jgi:hypothetical protein
MIRRSIGIIFVICFIAVPAIGMPIPWKLSTTMPPEDIRFIQTDYDDPGSLMALSTSGNLFHSTNWGTSWTSKNLSVDLVAQSVFEQPRQEGGFYVPCLDAAGDPSLWFTPDSGDSWQNLGSLPGSLSHLAVSPHIPGLLLGTFPQDGDRISLKRSETNGEVWNEVLNQAIGSVPVVWHPTSSWQAYWGQYRSTDFGITWQSGNSKDPIAGGYDIPPSIYAATSDGLFASKDDLTSWWPLLTSPVNSVCLNPRDPEQILTGFLNPLSHTPPAIFFSNDAGETFAPWSDGILTPISNLTIAADWLFFGFSEGAVYVYDERLADLDGSRRVDGGDLVILALAFGTTAGDSRFNPEADLNSDGIVDGNDLVILSMLWGHRFYYDKETPGDFPMDPS